MDAREFGEKLAGSSPVALAAGLGGPSPEAVQQMDPAFKNKVLGNLGQMLFALPGEVARNSFGRVTPGMVVGEAGKAGVGAASRLATTAAGAIPAVRNFLTPQTTGVGTGQLIKANAAVGLGVTPPETSRPPQAMTMANDSIAAAGPMTPPAAASLPSLATPSLPSPGAAPKASPSAFTGMLGGIFQSPAGRGINMASGGASPAAMFGAAVAGGMQKANGAPVLPTPGAPKPPVAPLSDVETAGAAQAGPEPGRSFSMPDGRMIDRTGRIRGSWGAHSVDPTDSGTLRALGMDAPNVSPMPVLPGPSSDRVPPAGPAATTNPFQRPMPAINAPALPPAAPAPAAPSLSTTMTPPVTTSSMMQPLGPPPKRTLLDGHNEQLSAAAETPAAKLRAAREASGQIPTADARARLQASRAAMGKLPTAPPASAAGNPFMPRPKPIGGNPFGPPLVKTNAAAAFGAAAASPSAVPVRRPISKTVKGTKTSAGKWATGHQFQGGRTTKKADNTDIPSIGLLLSSLATGSAGVGGTIGALDAKPGQRLRGFNRGAFGGLGAFGGAALGAVPAMGVGAGLSAAGAPKLLQMLGASATGLGSAMLGRRAATGLFDTVSPEKSEEKPKAKPAAKKKEKVASMDIGMANGAVKAKAKPVTLREFTGSHKEMGKRLAEACN